MLTIRRKLFIFIPLLVILLNIVSFFIYESGKNVQENYNSMINRMMLFKLISHETEGNLRSLSSYLIEHDQASYNAFLQHKETLRDLHDKLLIQEIRADNYIAIKNYENMILTFIDQEEHVIQSLQQQLLAKYSSFYEDATKTASYIQENGQSLVDLELSYYQPAYKQVLDNMNELNRLGAILFILTTILSIVFAIWLSRSITRPINKLVNSAKEIADGNLNVTPSLPHSQDEIGILSETFTHMLENIRSLIASNMESLEKDRLVKELELKALQSQINPHFLFNTLNVISKLAYLEGAEKTSDLTISVSSLLRYNLRKLDTPVTVEDELKNVMEYISIQKARFRDRFMFQLSVDEQAAGHPIPCLTLQPLLENAFVHGIENMEEGAFIRLDITCQKDTIQIIISDNGAGMDEEIRLALLHGSSSGTAPLSRRSTGLGIQNVFKRLQLFYERDDIVMITSEKQNGTAITLTLPWIKEEKPDVPTAHCG